MLQQLQKKGDAYAAEAVHRAKTVASKQPFRMCTTADEALGRTKCNWLHSVVSQDNLIGKGGMGRVYSVPNMALDCLGGGLGVIKVG
jgi:hypothetical protein